MKKSFFRSILLVLGITVCLFKTNVLAENIPVYLDNQKIELSNDVFIEDGRVMVPLRAICEALGYDVNWHSWSKEITVNRTGQIPYVLFKIDSFDVETLYEQKTIEVAPKIIEGRTYLPLRALVENLGDNIMWDYSSRTIHMAKNPKYDRVKSYNLEEIELNTRNYGHLPQIVNPSNGESKINENILLRLSDKDEDRVFSGIKTSVFRNDYKYEIRNNQNNIFSVSYDKISTFHKVTAGMLYPETCYSFCDTFYKDTGKKLQIEDILKGTKEDIENIIVSTYGKEVNFIRLCTSMSGSISTRDFKEIKFFTLDDAIKNNLLDNYDFYIEGDNLVFIIVIDEYIGEFKLNIPDNADLFQEDFLKNLNNI